MNHQSFSTNLELVNNKYYELLLYSDNENQQQLVTDLEELLAPLDKIRLILKQSETQKKVHRCITKHFRILKAAKILLEKRELQDGVLIITARTEIVIMLKKILSSLQNHSKNHLEVRQQVFIPGACPPHLDSQSNENRISKLSEETKREIIETIFGSSRNLKSVIDELSEMLKLGIPFSKEDQEQYDLIQDILK